MAYLHNARIVSLYGAVTCKDPLMIVMEYMPRGNLLGLLRDASQPLDMYVGNECARSESRFLCMSVWVPCPCMAPSPARIRS